MKTKQIVNPLPEALAGKCKCENQLPYLRILVDSFSESLPMLASAFESVADEVDYSSLSRTGWWWLNPGCKDVRYKATLYYFREGTYISGASIRPGESTKNCIEMPEEMLSRYLRELDKVTTSTPGMLEKLRLPVTYWWLWDTFEDTGLDTEIYENSVPLVGKMPKEKSAYPKIIITKNTPSFWTRVGFLSPIEWGCKTIIVLDDILKGLVSFYSDREGACPEAQGENWYWAHYQNDPSLEIEEDEA